MSEKDQITAQLKRLDEAISDAARQLAVYDWQLTPYWSEKGEIEQSILRTHRKVKGVVTLNPDGAGARVPMFDQLDELTKAWGPVKTDRAIVKTRLSGYEREARRLHNDLKFIKRKEGKSHVKGQRGPGEGQGSLEL